MQEKFKKFLISQKYPQTTVTAYKSSVKNILKKEGIIWHKAPEKIHELVKLYGIGGEKEREGQKNNRQPISALKQFEEFSNYIEQNDGIEEQANIQDAKPITDKEKERAPHKNLSYVESSTSKILKRNSRIAKKAIVEAEFKCQINPKHLTFNTKKDEKYMEGHHLIPYTINNAERIMEEFKRNIDCVENIVSLCPNCHRLIHLGKEKHKKEILEILYNRQKEKLDNIGIKISFEKLWEMYN